MERQTIIDRIIQKWTPRRGTGARRENGRYVIGSNRRGEALCLHVGEIDGTVLAAMYAEARQFGLSKPLHVYGRTSILAETETFRFSQLA